MQRATRTTAAAALLAALAAGTPTTASAQESRPPLAEIPAADLRISVEEYREHLHAVIGGSRLEELIFDRLLAREIASVDPESLPVDVREALADPDRAARSRLEQRIQRDFRGDREGYRNYLETIGRSSADELASARVEALREARIRGLVLARRKPDAQMLKRVFEDRYGPLGVQVRVSHAVVPFAEMRWRLAAGNRRRVEQIDPAKVEKLAQAAIAALQKQVADEPDKVVWEPIPGYRFQRFGVEFAEAAATQEVGVVGDPVRSGVGLHLVRVDERVVTEYDDVRGEIEAAARVAPVSLMESHLLREDLLTRYGVREALRRSNGGGR